MADDLRTLPTATSDGAIVLGAGKRVRQAIMTVYHMNGGDTWLSEWAKKNPGEFFTKLFAKMAAKEVEHKIDDSVEDLLDRLDGRAQPKIARVIDAEISDAVWSVPEPRTAAAEDFAPIVVGDDVDNDDEA